MAHPPHRGFTMILRQHPFTVSQGKPSLKVEGLKAPMSEEFRKTGTAQEVRSQEQKVRDNSAAAFWGFSRGGFPENACIAGAISERNFCEICRRKSPQNIEKHKTKLCAEVPERPLPKDPFFQLLNNIRPVLVNPRRCRTSVPFLVPEALAKPRALAENTVVAAMITELICFEPEICIRNGVS